MTGLELIAKERKEQIEKHGWTAEHDQEVNRNGELGDVAAYLLCYPIIGADREDYWPDNWSREWKDKMDTKDWKETLIIAGALIAAELDRLNSKNE